MDQIKTQLRIDLDDTFHDVQIGELITAAREWCEKYQNRAYLAQTFELLAETPKDQIRLPRPPLRSITSVEYEHQGEMIVWDANNYKVDDYSEPGNISRAFNSWPSSTMRIRYVAGHDTPSQVPAVIKQAIILLTCFWFESGFCDPPAAVHSLLSMDRVVMV